MSPEPNLTKAWKAAAKKYWRMNCQDLNVAAKIISHLQSRISRLELENQRLRLKLSEFDLEGD